MKDVFKYLLGAVAGMVITVGGVFATKGIKKSHGKKTIKAMLETIGLDKYNTEGKKIAMGAVNKGVAVCYVKIKDLEEVKNLSKAELQAVQQLCLTILGKEIQEAPAQEEKPQEHA